MIVTGDAPSRCFGTHEILGQDSLPLFGQLVDGSAFRLNCSRSDSKLPYIGGYCRESWKIFPPPSEESFFAAETSPLR